MRLTLLRATVVMLLALGLGQVISLPQQTVLLPETGYDGTRTGFDSFNSRYALNWPVPTTIDFFTAADGQKMRYAHWRAPSAATRAGVVVFFTGRTEYIEKNIHAFAELLSNNYEIWTMDWRGQGLSARAIAQYPDRGYIDDFGTFVSDAEIFIDDVVNLASITDTRKILLAHSMGGAIATLYLQDNPDQFDRAIMTSPMLGLNGHNGFVRKLFSLKKKYSCMNRLFGDCPWESNIKPTINPCDFNRPASDNIFRSMGQTLIYSHNPKLQREQICLIEAEHVGGNPDANLGLGSPTAGWLLAAFDAIDTVFEQREQLQTPVLIIGGGKDKIVKNASQTRFCDANAQYCCRLQIDSASHEILIETDPVRNLFFEYFVSFANSDSQTRHWCEQQ